MGDEKDINHYHTDGPRSFEAVFNTITSLYDYEATRLAQYAMEYPISVFTGPSGSGKTTIFLPLVQSILTGAGYDTVYINCSEPQWLHKNPSELIHDTPSSGIGVIVLDEVRSLYSTRKSLRHQAIRQANSLGWNVIAAIAYNMRDRAAKDEEVAIWQSEEKNDLAPVMHLKPFRLDRDLARELFIALRNKRNLAPLNSSIIESMLDVIPYNLRLIDLLSRRSPVSIDDAMQVIHKEVQWVLETLTPEEISNVYLHPPTG